ncbi:DUF3043 domain-containing protein [Cutibacterium avidum]|uniref:Integral membrane protein n=1 Tax=Cutibacterium avidum ATCC 25577 TaxID=997355 RepID=G4D0J2_9ACTN|nr:DUF3043 domain-containing protein [Cutibacterium avidum]EGY77261.1 hypothetical protein HMPREF9153_2214 [Cutibacterium avidum ATCC 25577]QRH10637.1 DUF3043 domain-containing protein [Cutibacterium avidum]
MGLFRPYEQGDSKKADSTDETVTAEPVSSTESSPSSATAAPRPTSDAANTKQEKQPEKRRHADKSNGAAKEHRAAAQATPAAQPKPRHIAKKGPTPTRAKAEAARRERLNPTLSKKEARKRERLAKRERQAAAMEAAERRPERGYIRDYVDSRWTFSEFIMPIFLAVMVIWLAMLFIAPTAVGAINAMSLGMLMVMLLWLVDSWRLWHGAKKGIRARYPNAPLRGLWAYLNNRAMTVRRWRNPEPRIERGEKID